MEQSRSEVHGQKSGERHALSVMGLGEGLGYGELKSESTETMEEVWKFCSLLS